MGSSESVAVVNKSVPDVTKAGEFKGFIPMFDRILVERFVAEAKTFSATTNGVIMIPKKAAGKVFNPGLQKGVIDTVIAVGSGARNAKGDIVPPAVKVGDKVLLPEYGGIKVEIEAKEYHMFRDTDVLGKWGN
ncbi:HSPE1 (predicted) [Pycnogonum litorale]